MRLTIIATLLGLAVGLASCKKQSTNQILLGEYASKTGPTATFGISSNEGVTLAIEQANAKGGVLGKAIKLISEDDQSKAEEAVNAVQKLINRDGVVAILGEVASKRSLAGGGVCQKYKVPMLSPASTNPGVTQIGDYVFRTCFTDDFQGGTLGRFALQKGWKRIAVLTDIANDYSKGLAEAFKKVYVDGGGTIVAEIKFREGDSDFKPQLTNIQRENPDAVCLPCYYTDVGNVLRQARELGLNVPFFGGDGWDSPDTLKLGKIADGCFFSDHYSPDDPRKEVQEFVAAYQKRFGKTPDAMATLGYDAANVMIDAIKRAGKAEPKAIRDALAATKDFPAVSGSITIDANRNARKPIVVLEIQGGKTRLDKIIPPE